MVAQEGWEQWLLELLLDGSPCIPCGATTQVCANHNIYWRKFSSLPNKSWTLIASSMHEQLQSVLDWHPYHLQEKISSVQHNECSIVCCVKAR